MTEPTNALSFYDLILRVAEVAGVAYYGTDGQGLAIIPVDHRDLFKCKRVVNDAIKMFIACAPKTGWRWMRRIMQITFAPAYEGTATAGTETSLTNSSIANIYANNYFNTYTIKITSGTGIGQTAVVTGFTGATGKFDFSGKLSGGSIPDTTSGYRICRSTSVIDADPARYLLSQDFGEVTGKIAYAADSNRGHILSWVNESFIRVNRETSVTTGYPIYAAIRPYGTRRSELIVDPQPVVADTIEFPYVVGFDQLEIETGKATATGDTSLTDTTLINLYPDNYFNSKIISILTGTGTGSYGVITGYVGTTGVFTVAGGWLKIDGSTGGIPPLATSAYSVEPVSNKHPAGFQFDNVIVSACLMQTQKQFKDIIGDFAQQFYQVDLPKAYELDARSAPLTLGDMGPGLSLMKERTWKDVDYS